MLRKLFFAATLAGVLAACTPQQLSDIEQKAKDAVSATCSNEPAFYAAFLVYADATNLKQSARDKAANADALITTICANQNESFVSLLAKILAQVAVITASRNG